MLLLILLSVFVILTFSSTEEENIENQISSLSKSFLDRAERTILWDCKKQPPRSCKTIHRKHRYGETRPEPHETQFKDRIHAYSWASIAELTFADAAFENIHGAELKALECYLSLIGTTLTLIVRIAATIAGFHTRRHTTAALIP